jgi:Homeodomain-like domain
LVASLLYLLFRRVLAVAVLRLRSREFKELEIVVLRHELAVLRRQISHPRLDESDRVFLAAAGRLLGRASRPSFFVRPDTLLGWHRQLVRRRWTYGGRRPGRPAVSEEIRELVLRLARENPRWGYQRIVGELAGVGVGVSTTTVAKILRQAVKGVKTTIPVQNRGFGTLRAAAHTSRALRAPATPLRFLPPVELIRFVRPEFERSGDEREMRARASRPAELPELARRLRVAADHLVDVVDVDLADAITGNRLLDPLDELRELGLVVA